MSWSISIEATAVEDFAAKADAARAAATVQTYNPEGADQADLAVKIAKEIVASGTVAGPGRKVYVTLSGHANPGHEPRTGYAKDCVNINIGQFGE